MNKKIAFIFLLLLVALCTYSGNSYKIMFYNVENYFDCRHDENKNDQEFLPGGIRGWNNKKYNRKTINIAKVIAAAGGDRFPALVGLAEVENDSCLIKLTKHSPLSNAGYSFVHFESPDIRGIDVALLYNPYIFQPYSENFYRVEFPFDEGKKTRDILYVEGLIAGRDTLSVLVCHLPSRWGGELETEKYRRYAAGQIKCIADSILGARKHADIVIMGDFNDTPENKSLREDLSVYAPKDSLKKGGVLYDLMIPFAGTNGGTHKYKAEWAVLDHIIVSSNLLKKITEYGIVNKKFMLQNDRKYFGKKPYRTYSGMKYIAGYSDHLPVFAEVSRY